VQNGDSILEGGENHQSTSLINHYTSGDVFGVTEKIAPPAEHAPVERELWREIEEAIDVPTSGHRLKFSKKNQKFKIITLVFASS
jgi:hypothetical protein